MSSQNKNMKKEHFLLVVLGVVIIVAIFLRLNQLASNLSKPLEKIPLVLEEDINQLFNLDNIGDRVNLDLNDNVDSPLLGGDIDKYGCLPSAGYTWCASKQICLRLFEENCPRYGLESGNVKEPREVVLFRPSSEEILSSPLLIEGEARGYWFFEATLPISLYTEDGDLIVAHYGEAQADWMTEEFVSFKSILEFTTEAERGYLVISKDNPSALPEFDATSMFMVKFK